MTTPTPDLDLTRTRAALAAYDEIDAAPPKPACEHEAWLTSLDEARLEVGRAFAADTADRNDPEVARRWASFSVERTRVLVDSCGLGKRPSDCGDPTPGGTVRP